MPDYERYEEQFNALMDVLNRMDDRYATLSDAELHCRKGTILYLIRTLREFAVGQFFFFYHGFNGGKGDYPKLNPASAEGKPVEFPPEHVLASILDQIAADITIIQLAAEQRRLVSGQDSGAQIQVLTVQDTEVDLLTVGDWLGYRAFWAEVKQENKEGWGVKTVLTYLTDSVKVRVVPYANVMLLGIPYGCKNDVRRLLAIPHEVGHFLFWYSYLQKREDLQELDDGWDARKGDLRLNAREVFYKFTNKPNRDAKVQEASSTADDATQTPPWAEEIFADVYSVLVGGPLAILTAMDVAMEHSADAFQDFASDDTHPTPLIRPVLMMKALASLSSEQAPARGRMEQQFRGRWPHKLYEQAQRVAEELLAMWNEKLKTRAVTNPQEATQIAWDLSATPTTYPVEALVVTARNALQKVYLDLDQRQGKEWGWSNRDYAVWSNALELQTNAEKMLCQHIEFLKEHEPEREIFEFPVDPTPKLYVKSQPHDSPPDLWRKWALDDKRYFENMPTGEIYAGKFETAMDPKTRPNDPPYWLAVFGAGGWDTHGPCGNPGHPYDTPS